MAPDATIDVIAANSASVTDLMQGAETAATTLGASVVSMSFGEDLEYYGDGAYEQFLDATYLCLCLRRTRM